MPVPPPRAVDAALALRRRLQQAADAVLPAWAAMFVQTLGLLRVHVIAALVEVGVPAALADGPAGLDELAQRTATDADTLQRVLRVAVLDGLLTRDRRGRYKLTRTGAVLRPDRPDSLDPWVRYMALASTREAFAQLPRTLRSGTPSFRLAHDTTVWDWFAAHPEEEALFASAMRSITAFDGPDLAQSKLWPDSGTLCDVAGGTGELIAAVLGRHPELRGVLVDVPGVLAEARERRAGVDRLDFATGDLFTGIDVRADVYSLKNILHDWDDDTCVKILETVRAAMAPGARVIVVEQLLPEGSAHAFAAPTDIQMLTQTDGGRERSAAELRALLGRAGLRPGRLERVGVQALVEGHAG